MSAALSNSTLSPSEALRSQLDDPEVATALVDILQHADLLALLVVGLDGAISRSEVIGDELLASLADMRTATDQSGGFNPKEAVASLMALAPLLRALSESGITSPAAVDQIGNIGRGIAGGLTTEPVKVTGALSLLRQLKDPDVSRGMGLALTLLKSIGANLNSRPQGSQ